MDDNIFFNKPDTRIPRNQQSINPISSTVPMRRAMCKIYLLNPQSIASATPTVLNFDASSFDTVGLHDNVTNNSRITIPTTGRTSGLWHLHGKILWSAGLSSSINVSILVTPPGGGTASLASTYGALAGAGKDISLEVYSYIYDPIPGTYYQLQVSQLTGGNLTLLNSADLTYFEVVHLW